MTKLKRRIVLAGLAVLVVATAALVATVGDPAQARAHKAGPITSVDLTLLGKSDLAAPGLDGQTKPRGQNGDVAVLKNVAYVGGGALFHGAQSSPGRICTDYGGVKVVDLNTPSSPKLLKPISIEDTKGIASAGTPRNGLKLDNVSVSAGAVDALSVRTPTFTGDVLAIATQRCEPSLFTGARIEFWDVSNPAAPAKLGVFDPATLPGPTPGSTGAWGIFEDVRMFTRGDKLFAVATTPFSIGNSHDASPFGDFRLIDLTDIRSPKQVGTFPPVNIGEDSVNGCRTFLAGRAAAPTPDGSHAILSFYDGATVFGPKTGAVFNLDLDNLPKFVSDVPLTINPVPPFWGYTQDPTVEGNAADVQPFLGPNRELLTILSEDDIDPAITNLTIGAPASAAGTSRGCTILVGKHVYELPNQQAAGDIVYVGRACPASTVAGSPNTAADELLADPKGKLALVQGGGSAADGCSAVEKARRLQEAGALALLQSSGSETLNTLIAGPNGGLPPIPFSTIPQSAYDKMQLVTAPVLNSATFPASMDRTSTTNVTGVASPGRGDRFRFKIVADATDRVARGQTKTANRFTVTAGQSYLLGAFLQVETFVGGSFHAAVVWYDAAGAQVGESDLKTLSAVTPRTRYEQAVTAPAGAVKGAVKFEWTGAAAEGTAYADAISLVTAGLTGTLKDSKGEWGAQRIIDFSKSPPAEIATYRSPKSTQWPPPDNGIYAPRLARTVGSELAFTTWMSDGLRVLDVSTPSAPREVGAYVPPAVADPAPGAGAGGGFVRGQVWPNITLVTGVDVIPKDESSGTVVISDINAGLYVLAYKVNRKDLTAPSAPTVTGPRKTSSAKPKYTFSSTDEDNARGELTYRCAFDGTNLHACGSTYSQRLKKGKHTLRVQASDAAGNLSPVTRLDVVVKGKKKR